MQTLLLNTRKTTENGIVVGNVFDKYGSSNPIVKRLMHGYTRSLDDFVRKANPKDIHEIGCGEGHWVLRWNKMGIPARGSDVSTMVINHARVLGANSSLDSDTFVVKDIAEMGSSEDGAHLIVCCEVLEHLQDPAAALEILAKITESHCILSVPNEPLWRILNILRGSYLTRLGNTPGHINHWSREGFIRLVSKYFAVVDMRSPLPWTMLLCKPMKRRFD